MVKMRFFSRNLSFFQVLICGMLLVLPASALAQNRVLPSSHGEAILSFSPLVKETAPAVVNIYTSKKVKVKASPFLSDPLFRQLFEGGAAGIMKEKMVQSLGSGIIVRPQGLIITNNHVVDGSEEIKVVLTDRREFAAKVLLIDKKSDLAVLKIDVKDEKLPYVKFGDSDTLEVGDMVLAIGNPFGVGQTVTSGIISAQARTTAGINDLGFFIQTDAAINPGNSGGALIDMQGKLIGVNTAIYSKGGGSNGIGFATPVNMVKIVLESAEAGKTVERPWLGASGQNITQELADSMGLKKPGGVLVSATHPGGSADEAGLKKGDVILAIGDKPVPDEQTLRYRILTYGVGAKTTLTILRSGEEKTLDLTLLGAPETPPRETSTLSGNHPLAGLTVMNLSPKVADEMQLNLYEGVVIADAAKGSPPDRLGIKRGDIIATVNNTKVKTVRELAEQLLKPTGHWTIQIVRGKQVLNLNIDAPKGP
ncbi:MAG: DegQ family serine endoprotease [Proteobacteria bacterium]|nr:DegQ family serine endoprotease [Pseudomonadota bacterium]